MEKSLLLLKVDTMQRLKNRRFDFSKIPMIAFWVNQYEYHARKTEFHKIEEELDKMLRSWSRRPKALWALTKVFLEYILIRVIFGYAEKPKRIAGIAGSLIVGSAVLYWRLGAVGESGNPDVACGFWNSLYFSVVTFTTLGFGDLTPAAGFWSRSLAGSEAVMGAFLMAAFIVTLARRWGRA